MIQRYFNTHDAAKEIVEVDVQAQNTQDPIELFPWLYTIFINSETIKVLSKPAQQDIQQCKQMLKDELEKNGIYVGCKIVGSWHEVYFYLKSAKGIESKIRKERLSIILHLIYLLCVTSFMMCFKSTLFLVKRCLTMMTHTTSL